jgi:hypothetical protein
MTKVDVRVRSGLGDKLGLVFMLLFGAAFAALGVFAGISEAMEAIEEGDPRKLWVSILGGGLFVAFGAAAIAVAIFSRRRAGERDAEAALHPGEPWMLNAEWAARKIRSRTGASAAILSAFGTVWCAITTPLAFQIPEQVAREGNPLIWFAALFPLVGVGLMFAAFRAFVRWRKFGSSVLELKTLPGVIGGRLEASLQLSAQIDSPDGMELQLECIHKRTTGAGKNRSTHERILWNKERAVARARFGLGMQGTAIPVEFTVPFGCQATRGTGTDDEVLWRVVAKAKVSGVDYYARFTVPVFETEESSEAVNDDGEIPEVVVSSLAGGEAIPGSKIRVRPWGRGGREFWFGPARNPIAACVTTLVAAGIGAITAILPEQGAPWIATVGCGFVASFTALGATVHWIGASRVQVEHGAIRVTRGPFGIGRTQTWNASDLSRINVRRGSQYGNNLYWDIKLEIDRPGRKHSDARPWPTVHAAGSRLPGENEARALANAMSETLGIDRS